MSAGGLFYAGVTGFELHTWATRIMHTRCSFGETKMDGTGAHARPSVGWSGSRATAAALFKLVTRL